MGRQPGRMLRSRSRLSKRIAEQAAYGSDQLLTVPGLGAATHISLAATCLLIMMRDASSHTTSRMPPGLPSTSRPSIPSNISCKDASIASARSRKDCSSMLRSVLCLIRFQSTHSQLTHSQLIRPRIRPRSHAAIRLVAAAGSSLVIATLCGCGTKGPLEMPPPRGTSAESNPHTPSAPSQTLDASKPSTER
jgi:predicted small lipoprotein YifL